MSNLQQRVIVGAIGIGLFLGLILSGLHGTLFLMAALIVLCLDEFYELSPFPMPPFLKFSGVLAGLFFFGFWLIHFGSQSQIQYEIVLLFSPLLLIFLVFAQLPKPFEAAAWLVFGWFFLITPWISLLMSIEQFDFNPGILLGLFFLLWAADSGAYFAGKSLGKTKLLPRVSPKKTWEGLAGGLALSALTGIIISYLVGGFSQAQWVVLAFSTTIFGTLGDLAESTLKRSLNLKDSGKLLPGHGGILDRFDGLFVASPINACIIHFWFDMVP